jgi:protein-S-isoprenylcysteine O-methyltransferase Ste14
MGTRKGLFLFHAEENGRRFDARLPLGRSEMGRARAAAGSLLFLIVAPGVVAGLVPWWITGWRVREPLPHWIVLRLAGTLVLVAGVAVLVHAFLRFVVEGTGTPAPVAPTERLVVGGLYRYVRNPMYLAVAGIIVGQAFVLGQLVLLLYAGAFVVVTAAFVRGYEEPTLGRRYGAQYERYRRAVPGWWPRRPPPDEPAG